MRRFLFVILGIMSITSAFFLFFKISTGPIYNEYEKLWDYRRLHPEFIPDARTIQYFSAGNTSTYADWLWISLIQYIGDNIGNGKFVIFSNPILKTITELHPHFIRPYIISLLLAPNPNTERPTYERDLEIVKDSYMMGIKGMGKNCDAEKIKEIQATEISKSLWDNQKLKNPCTDGMLPYYVAYAAGNIGDLKSSESYYKIASMQDDGPQASRFLSILMRAKDGDYKSAAQRFFLIGTDGYDEPPYNCQGKAFTLAEKTEKLDILSDIDIKWMEDISYQIEPAKDTTNPLAGSASNCYDSTNRGIKQLFLWYISEKAKPFPEIKDGKELVDSGVLPSIPTTKEQKGWNVRKRNSGSWEYSLQ